MRVMWFLWIARLEIIKNTRTVVQKSPLQVSELIAKYHVNLSQIWYQNLIILEWISIPKTHPKRTSSFASVLVSKVIQNCFKTNPNCLVGSDKIEPGATLATSGQVLGLTDTFTAPQIAHFDVIWKPIGPDFEPLQVVLSLLMTHFFDSRAKCTAFITGSTVHDSFIGAHPRTRPQRWSFTSQSHTTPFSVDVQAFEAHTQDSTAHVQMRTSICRRNQLLARAHTSPV